MDATAVDWIERLAGWGVMAIVMLYGMRWGMMRADRALDQMDAVVASFREALESFRNFENEERETHEALMSRHDEVLKEIMALRREMNLCQHDEVLKEILALRREMNRLGPQSGEGPP